MSSTRIARNFDARGKRHPDLAIIDSARAWGLGAEGKPTPIAKYALISAIYVAIYVATNFVTEARNFEHSGITLWSPDNGLSLLLLVESSAYAPVVVIASIAVDLFVGDVSYNIYTIIGSNVVLTLGYLFVSIVLRDAFNFEKWRPSYANTIAVLAVIPASAALTGITYCGFLYLSGALPSGHFYSAAINFWIGDTVGMIVVLPAATAIHDFVAKRAWRGLLAFGNVMTLAFVATFIIVFLMLSTENNENQYLFNIIYLPMIWLAIHYGFNAVSAMLLLTQVLLFFILSHRGIGDFGFNTFQTLMFVMASTGQLLGAVLTEREQTARLLRNQQSELARVSAHATSAAMAVTMAHEISQPLSSLASYVHSARRLIDAGQTSATVRAPLMKAESEAARARGIIERIRDFVSSGRLELRSEELAPIVRKIISLNLDEARSRGVDLVAEAIETVPAIPIDRIAIEQALNNLIVNAIDSASLGTGGHVAVRLSSRGEFVALQVDDDGPGVAAEMTERLFDVFETTKAKGMGLGLPLTREIARRHSGRLAWTPLKPSGASFSMELPIHGPENQIR
jgi:signal transduction histidine kinase